MPNCEYNETVEAHAHLQTTPFSDGLHYFIHGFMLIASLVIALCVVAVAGTGYVDDGHTCSSPVWDWPWSWNLSQLWWLFLLIMRFLHWFMSGWFLIPLMLTFCLGLLISGRVRSPIWVVLIMFAKHQLRWLGWCFLMILGTGGSWLLCKDKVIVTHSLSIFDIFYLRPLI